MNFASRFYEEKRNFIRMKVNTSVDVKLDNGSASIYGQCRDLSGGGMLIELPNTLAVGAEVEVLLASTHGHTPMLKALARVQRVQAPTLRDKACVAGLEIIEMLD